MVITAITQQVRNPDRVSIYADAVFRFSLTLDQLLDSKLKVGSELSDQEASNFTRLSNEGKLRMRVLNWLLMRPHSEREFRTYLEQKMRVAAYRDISSEYCEKLVDEAKQKKLIDDEAFAIWWVGRSSRTNRSRNVLKAELLSKGVEHETISRLINEHPEKQALQSLVDKLKNRQKYQDRNKLLRYLATKGFSYSLIEEVLAEGSGTNAG